MAKWNDILKKLMGSGVITVDEAGQQTISNSPDLEGLEVEGLDIFEPIVSPVTETTADPIATIVDNVSREELTAIIDRLIKLEQLVIAVDEVNNTGGLGGTDNVEVW